MFIQCEALRFSAPSQVPDHSADILNSSQVEMKWDPPSQANGPLKGYQIMAFYEGGNQSWNSSVEQEPYKFNMLCPNVDDFLQVNYTIRAISYDSGTDQYFMGPFSTPVSKEMCKMSSVNGKYIVL